MKRKVDWVKFASVLLILVLVPVVIVFTMDFSERMSTGVFLLNVLVRFLVVYFAVAVPAHYIAKKRK